jgi:DNA/RNA endonuclease YhcR with UshA esterase domain
MEVRDLKLSRLVKLLLALMIAIPFPALVYNMGNKAHAVTATDPAPFIPHKGDYKGQVLFDNTHGETAGAADWVIDGGFSDFANAIANQGYDVKELRKTTPITYDDLKDYNVFVLGEANIPFKASEQAAMLQYVQDGGSIFFVGDHYNSDRNLNRWDSGEVYNGFRRGAWDDPTKGMSAEEANSSAMQGVTSSDWLGQNFGIRFRSNALGDVTSGETVVPPSDSFNITKGVTTVEMHAGSTLAILDPTKAKGLIYLPEGTPSWGDNAVDQGVYNGGGIDEGAFAAIAKVGKGKAAFIGDSSPVEDPTTKYLREDNGQPKTTYDGFLGEGQDALFLTNTVLWLAQQEDYTSFEGKVSLSPVTQLYDWELPQNTTEPEHEPWSEPPTGYKWWDPTTFANGSYGSPVDPTLQPIYRFIHGTLPTSGDFDITVSVDNLAPNQTLTNLKLGMYLDGGLQVAKFQNPTDGSWPSSYGYSDYFSVTADDTGHASITLKGEMKDDTNGTVNIRLKQGSKILYTDTTVVGEAQALSIKAARTQGTGTVTVEGVITTTPGTWGSKGFYLQDDTGGIYVYQSDASFKAGEKIKMTGELSTYKGELELSNDKAEVIGQTNLPAPKVVTTVDDTNQGEVLKIQNVTIENIGSPDKYGTFEFDAVNGDSTTRVRVDNRTGVKYSDWVSNHPEGSALDITGVGSIFNGTYLLKPRSSEDFTAANSVFEYPLSTLAEARTLLDGSIVNVEGVITTPLGVWGSQGFYLQDETGGIYVYQGSSNYHQGEKVKITAQKTTYNNEVELQYIEKSTDEGDSTLPNPKVVTIVDDSNQGQLIKLQDVKVTNLADVGSGTFEFDAVNGDTTTRVRMDKRSGFDYSDFTKRYKEGTVLDITGIGSIFRGTYQLKPRSADDFNQAPVIGDLDPLSIMQTDAYQQTVNVTDDKDPNPTVAITLDGETISNPITIDPLQLALGDHVIHVTATDNEGKMSERTFVLHVDFDVDHLDELLAYGEGRQLVGQLGHSLESKVNAIQNTPNEKAQANQLKALRNEISAQAGKKINQDFAQTFITDIDYLSVN